MSRRLYVVRIDTFQIVDVSGGLLDLSRVSHDVIN